MVEVNMLADFFRIATISPSPSSYFLNPKKYATKKRILGVLSMLFSIKNALWPIPLHLLKLEIAASSGPLEALQIVQKTGINIDVHMNAFFTRSFPQVLIQLL